MRFGVIYAISKRMDDNNVKVENPQNSPKWAHKAEILSNPHIFHVFRTFKLAILLNKMY